MSRLAGGDRQLPDMHVAMQSISTSVMVVDINMSGQAWLTSETVRFQSVMAIRFLAIRFLAAASFYGRAQGGCHEYAYVNSYAVDDTTKPRVTLM